MICNVMFFLKFCFGNMICENTSKAKVRQLGRNEGKYIFFFMLLFFEFRSKYTDLLPCLYPELKAFYCQDTLTKVIYCDSI